MKNRILQIEMPDIYKYWELLHIIQDTLTDIIRQIPTQIDTQSAVITQREGQLHSTNIIRVNLIPTIG